MEPQVHAHDALSFDLRGHAGPVVLDARGVHHPLSPRGGRTFTLYEDVVHLTLSQRALWIGARRSVTVLPRKAFLRPDAPEALARALLDKIAARPGSREQLERMAAIEERARNCPPSYATWGLALLCVAVYALQLALGHDVFVAGYMSPPLVADGDAWRLVTANLLHDETLPLHLHIALNLLALAAFGSLCERPLGPARTIAVMGVSGLAAMTACAWNSLPVVGVSGVASGLVGAVVWLEHFRAEELPAWWRVPRRVLYGALLLTLGIGLVVPFIAGSAHVAGFAAGALCAALLADRPLRSRAAPPPVRALAGLVLVATLAGLGKAGAELLGPGDFGARYLDRLARLPGITPVELNNQAWFAAIDESSSQEELAAALSLAERAVRETDRRQATILDTLAELQFLTGEREAALATIEEAIALEPGQPYYTEQKRRFLGERSDRPDPLNPLRPPPETQQQGSELTA